MTNSPGDFGNPVSDLRVKEGVVVSTQKFIQIFSMGERQFLSLISKGDETRCFLRSLSLSLLYIISSIKSICEKEGDKMVLFFKNKVT